MSKDKLEFNNLVKRFWLKGDVINWGIEKHLFHSYADGVFTFSSSEISLPEHLYKISIKEVYQHKPFNKSYHKDCLRNKKIDLTRNENQKQLDRLRMKYVRMAMKYIIKDITGDVLLFCAKRMVRSGLYKTSIKDARFYILRRMWRWDNRGLKWSKWCLLNGWDIQYMKRLTIEEVKQRCTKRT